MVEVRDIVEGSMIGLARSIQQGMRDRNLNAAGTTSRSIEVGAVGGRGIVQGTLVANDNWRYVGNGRGPGKFPPLDPLRAWIKARGLEISEYALQRTIGLKGSRDYRKNNRNVFLDGIEAWEKNELPKTEDQAGQYLVDRTEQIVLQATK